MPLIRLGQLADASSGDVVLFTVDPAIYSFVTARSLIITNRNTGAARTFRVAHNTGGGTSTTADYWFYDTTIVPGQGLLFPLDCGLSPGDTVRVTASAADVTFQIYGEK